MPHIQTEARKVVFSMKLSALLATTFFALASSSNAQTTASVIECVTDNGRPILGEYESANHQFSIFKIEGNRLLKWSGTGNHYLNVCDTLQFGDLQARPVSCNLTPTTIRFEWKNEHDFVAFWGDDVRHMKFYFNINRVNGKTVFGWNDWFANNPSRQSGLETLGQCKRSSDPAEGAPIF